MAGVDWDKCRITGCQYRRSGSQYQHANFGFSRAWLKTDTTNWMAELVDDSTVDIWDINPRP